MTMDPDDDGPRCTMAIGHDGDGEIDRCYEPLPCSDHSPADEVTERRESLGTVTEAMRDLRDRERRQAQTNPAYLPDGTPNPYML